MQQSGALQFFSIQPLGIVIEDLILFRLVSGFKPKRPPTMVQRCIGFAWVGLWMAWTAPAYLYPIMDKSGSDDGVAPISIIGLIKHKLG